MRSHNILPVLVGIFVITGTIASGPIFSAHEQTKNADADQRVAGGEAEVSIAEAPTGSIRIRKSGYGSNVYILNVPSSVLVVSNVSGRPLLSFKAQIVDLGYAQTEIAILQPGMNDKVKLAFGNIVFSENRVKEDSYTVELSIVLRASGKETIFYRNETIQVQH